MPQKDYIGQKVRISQEAITFSLEDLYRVMRNWFQDRGYIIVEKEHKEFVDAKGVKHTAFEWEVGKPVDSYTKTMMDIEFEALTKEITVESMGEKVGAQKGSVDIAFKSYLLKDIEEEWKVRDKGSVGKFIREFYDRFAAKDKFDSYAKKLNEDLQAIINDIKTFLKLKRFEY